MHVEELAKIGLLTRRTVTIEGEETVEELHFFYDAQSRPAMVEYNGVMYSYLHNLQGDIIGIVDAAGNLVVEYKYDAWGKPIYETGSLLSSLGNLNPFRYRSYIWDSETTLYYLRDRYYDAIRMRFINADVAEIALVFGEALKSNVFVYCNCNPIMEYDPSGCISWKQGLAIVATAATVLACIAFVGFSFGAGAAAVAGISTACATVDGAFCAKIDGGDVLNGALAGAAGGATGSMISFVAGGVGGSIAGRAVGSLVFDVGYDDLAGNKPISNMSNYIMDIEMDSILSIVYYYYNDNGWSRYVATLANGIGDGFVDVVQTSMIVDNRARWGDKNRSENDIYSEIAATIAAR